MDFQRVGPFDSDAAADFIRDLYDTDADGRLAAIEAALRIGADPSDDFLDSHEAEAAIVAAAIVRTFRATGMEGVIPEPIAFLGSAGLPPISRELVALAARALERTVAADSELNEMWAATANHQSWRATVLALCRELTA
ncbi:DUF4259 domain-containing protein [Embleya hyalina]|uniref:DUF4259 domain-containing protein n=1 Tax=Embleya hyalina TaxID=516124 RepID=A0A401YXJ5_9ACTN|nr:DUF4259 domain-containing protein [Embleya hyalina]GCD99323.1 hypothetical protein EHYA_07038 [Embleya hyalina]